MTSVEFKDAKFCVLFRRSLATASGLLVVAPVVVAMVVAGVVGTAGSVVNVVVLLLLVVGVGAIIGASAVEVELF